ncbi:hypothetical protein SASPL_129565 [Salvia splendens]|uniref:Insulysin n=1 Tax=Salvia splendens TaxID=180675 RepID=A0A8X8ZN35_SALSN|nr:hypothetical protein SASPL_129565 [Salvia splendens]
MALGVMKPEDEIIKPRNDKREYRRIVLKNNLQVLLISDAETDKCAASMDVRVGAFSDPEGLEGLAHFLEHVVFYVYIHDVFAGETAKHMLFYASEKYPEEDSYSKYISEHGGSTNAFTASENTNYYFDVNPDSFEEALDRFAQFFINPLMSADATTREIKAVDSENQKNLLSDAWRMNQLQKHLSVQDHPYHKFSTGNWDTLEVRPKARGLDTRQELLKFYKDNYSTNLMHLVIYTKDGLDKCESLVRSYFEDIRNTNRNFINFPGQPCDSESLQVGLQVYLLVNQIGLVSFLSLKSALISQMLAKLAAICETSFHYQDKIRPIDYVVSVAMDMQFYPPKDWLVGSSLPTKFNSEVIQSALKELSPFNVRIFWESTKFEGLTDSKEPWYGTAYSVERLTGSKIEQWANNAPGEGLHLPVKNVFIPTDLSLKTVSEQMKLPVLLRKTPYSRLWYKPDTAFSTPKAYVKIDFNCPSSGSSPESKVLTKLFTRLLMDYLNEYAYDAQVAGLYYSVSNTESGFQVTVVGYNHKLTILLETVIQQIANFEVKPDRFSVIKELVTKEYQNLNFQQPYQQVMNYCSLILQDQTWPWTEELEVLPHLEVEHLVRFYPSMISRIFLECFAAGNLEPKEAESMIQHIEDVFFKSSKPISKPLFGSQYMTNRVVKLERGINYFYSVEGLNPSDENSALVHYIQVHQDDFKLNVTLQLFAVIAKQPAFHQLRSVEQLGYITVLMERNDSGVRGVQFIIQSNVKGPGQIDLRVESFLKMFETKLYEMPSDEFKSNVNALIKMKLEKHKNLREESTFYWREVSDGTFKFDRKEREVAALKQLTQKDLIDFFNKYIKVGAPLKKGLSVRVYGSAHASEYKTDNSQPPESNVPIEDIFSFRRSRPLYGSFKGGFGHLKL